MWSELPRKVPLRIAGHTAPDSLSPGSSSPGSSSTGSADEADLADDLHIVAQQLSDDAARLGERYPAPAFDPTAVEHAPAQRMPRGPVVAAMALVATLVVTSPYWQTAWRGLAPRSIAAPRAEQQWSVSPSVPVLGSVSALAEPNLPTASGPTISFDRLSTSEQEAVLDLLEQQSDPTIGLSL